MDWNYLQWQPKFEKKAYYPITEANNDTTILGTSGGVMINTSEFESHWVIHSFISNQQVP